MTDLMPLEQWRKDNPEGSAREWARIMLGRLSATYNALAPVERAAVRLAVRDVVELEPILERRGNHLERA